MEKHRLTCREGAGGRGDLLSEEAGMQTLFSVGDSLQFVKGHEGWTGIFRSLTWPVFEYLDSYLVCRAWQKEPVKILPAKIPLTCRVATLDDLALFESMVPKIRIRRFARKMRLGEECLLGFHQDQLIGIAWAAFSGTPSSRELPFQLDESEAYLWGGRCLPEYRSQGVVTSMATYLYAHLKSQGIMQAYHLVEKKNKPALRLAEKMSAQIAGDLTVLRLFDKRLFRFKGYDLAPISSAS
jgi:ribosomal protein S18 acetylase RimI-like enzyme